MIGGWYRRQRTCGRIPLEDFCQCLQGGSPDVLGQIGCEATTFENADAICSDTDDHASLAVFSARMIRGQASPGRR